MPDTTTQETTVLRVPSTMKNLVEALIFAAQEPLTVKQIKAIYEQGAGDGETLSIDAEMIREVVAGLNEEFHLNDKPYRILQIAGGYQFATLAQYAEWLGKLYKEQARRKLSQSSVETLAIIAYKQPIARPEIEAIRGVNCDYVLATLLEKDLVTIVGRAPTPGRPLLYGTTREFLKHFGLNEITDLPRPREIEEILGESQFETERRMLEAQAGALEMKKEEEDFKSRLPHIPKRKPDLDGEVKIVQRKKQREIKTVDSQEQDNAKDADQETLGFTEENPTARTPDQLEPIAQIESSIEPAIENAFSIASKPPASQPTMEVKQVEDTTRIKLELTGETRSKEVLPTPENDAENRQATEKAEPMTEVVAPISVENAMPTEASFQSSTPEVPQAELQPKSAWHNWKEKIQTFIRNLFG